MSKVKIQGNASGTGVVTLTAPNTNTDRTITLPDDTQTLIGTNASGNVGIGTTSPTNSSGYSTLSLNGYTGGQLAFQTGSSGKQFIYSNATDLNIYNSVTGGKLAFQTQNTERMRIDSAGRVTMPYQPAFQAKGDSSGWTANGSGNTQINTWGTVYQRGGTNFSTATGKFTAPVAGWYLFIFGAYTRVPTGSSSYTYPRLYRNGNSVAFDANITHYSDAGDQDTGHTITALVDMGVNDYVQAGFYQVGTGDHHTGSQSFQGHLIG